MIEELDYNNKKYIRVNGKWVDPKTYMTVPYLQSTLDNLWSLQNPKENLPIEKLVVEADRLKEAGNYGLASKYYETALKNSSVDHRYVLPRLTSCYRLQGLPGKAIEYYKYTSALYGNRIQSAPLFTSIAAAYCDIQDYESAKRFADRAFAFSKGTASGELAAVYGRIRKETTGSGSYE